ncbi:MAG TPA: hypothetical protein VD997_03995 [Phycisphaerales bacterium]|nr:hypothetical protein [Phycisphaerales bacterium]
MPVRTAVVTAVSAALGIAVAPAQAQWNVTALTPPDASTNAFANGTAGGVQVGNYGNNPALWTGTQASHVNMLPAGAHSGQLLRTDGGQHVGLVRWSGFSDRQATLWGGTAASATSLHPAGAFLSTAHGIGGGQQVGEATFTSDQNLTRAGLWSGTAGSWVSLHPSGVNTSTARGTDGTQQVGQVNIGGQGNRAAFWSGTAASFVNLHPTGYQISIAVAVHNGQQVGLVQGTPGNHAALWSGSAASFLSLTPAGAFGSSARGVFNGVQVGTASFPDAQRAGLWRGTAASWEDLHQYLPAGYSSSAANSIWSDGTTTYIAGSAFNPATARNEAMLWTYTVPAAPTTGVLGLAGLLAAGRRRTR